MDTPPDFSHRRGLRFDGTINAGHILTAIMFGVAIVTMWVNFKVSEANMESELKIHASSISELRSTQQHIVETQQQQAMTEQKLQITLDYLAKQPLRQGPP